MLKSLSASSGVVADLYWFMLLLVHDESGELTAAADCIEGRIEAGILAIGNRVMF
jgi:hypothetical protein